MNFNLKWDNVGTKAIYVAILMFLLSLLGLGYSREQLIAFGFYCFLVSIVDKIYSMVKETFIANIWSGLLILALVAPTILAAYALTPSIKNSLGVIGTNDILIFIVMTALSLVPSVLARFYPQKPLS